MVVGVIVVVVVNDFVERLMMVRGGVRDVMGWDVVKVNVGLWVKCRDGGGGVKGFGGWVNLDDEVD